MDADSWIGLVLIVVALVVLIITAAAEADVVAISRARVRLFAAKGLPRAAALEAYIQERHALLGALAVARNLAVVLGVGVGAFLVLRESGDTWAVLAVTMGIAFLTLVLVEAVPRLVVTQNPERWGLRLVPAISVIKLVFGLPARALDFVASSLLRLRGRRVPFETSDEDEELLRLVELHEGNGDSENGERQMIRRIAQLVDTAVREIMVPRIDIVAAETDASVQDVLNLVLERGYSRIPLYEETIDNVVGVVYAKDLLRYISNGQQPLDLKSIARPPFFIPETKRVDELLAELRENRVHIAIVVDEYGGTAGLATIEDVLEEIVGEIQDEYDREEATIQQVNETEAVVDARVSLDDLNELFDLEIEGEDFDTVGGFVYHELGRMPSPGDEVRTDGLKMHVLSVLGRRIKKVRVTKEPAQDVDETTED